MAAVIALTTMGGVDQVHAAFDENLNMYTLDAVVVEADRTKNKFGDTITEQSYYRTGGDVKVITREEIEKRHYTDMTEAIKRIPGVTFASPGYRGGQYGYAPYSNSMSINGDSRVVVLIDGRRVDNSASTRFGTSNADGTRVMVDLNQLISMENVEKIEVIKGPGASIYGADATGGVINIITRQGGEQDVGTIDLSTGSWDKHVYGLTYSGSAGNDKSWKYFISASRQMSGDTKYHDGITDKNYTYKGTHYDEESASIRVDKDLGNDKKLSIFFNHMNGKDGYPLTAPDHRYMNQADWDRIIEEAAKGNTGDDQNPGYHNMFYLDGLAGSYTAFQNNDLDVKYTFQKDNGMESFIRVYNQNHRYWDMDRYYASKGSIPDGNGGYNEYNWILPDGSHVPFPGSPEWDEFVKTYESKWHPEGWNDLTGLYVEKNRGIQLQYGKSIGKHDLLGSFTYDRSNVRTLNNYGPVSNSDVSRKSILGFIQDKIHVNDKWDITPAVRYSHYSGYSNGTVYLRDANGDYMYKKDANGNFILNEDGRKIPIKVNINDSANSTIITPALNTEYEFSDTFSAYAGWTKVYRPVKANDYGVEAVGGGHLEDEKGDAWTLGLRKDLGSTEIGIHYDWTNMSNSITYYPVVLNGNPYYMAVNANEKKQSFNVTVDQKLGEHWTLGLAYTHMKDKYSAKNGEVFGNLGTSLDNVNTRINELRPANYYTANLAYDNGKWYSGLLVNYYTGMNTSAFTSRHALVLDWNLNYEVNTNLTTYLTVTNLTNEAYENAYSPFNGIGAAPQPGRAFMVGARYKF